LAGSAGDRARAAWRGCPRVREEVMMLDDLESMAEWLALSGAFVLLLALLQLLS
jgi:hypothetical protein